MPMRLYGIYRHGRGLVLTLANALLLFLLVDPAGAKDWVKLYDSNQTEINARIIAAEGESVTIERQRDK